MLWKNWRIYRNNGGKSENTLLHKCNLMQCIRLSQNNMSISHTLTNSCACVHARSCYDIPLFPENIQRRIQNKWRQKVHHALASVQKRIDNFVPMAYHGKKKKKNYGKIRFPRSRFSLRNYRFTCALINSCASCGGS